MIIKKYITLNKNIIFNFRFINDFFNYIVKIKKKKKKNKNLFNILIYRTI